MMINRLTNLYPRKNGVKLMVDWWTSRVYLRSVIGGCIKVPSGRESPDVIIQGWWVFANLGEIQRNAKKIAVILKDLDELFRAWTLGVQILGWVVEKFRWLGSTFQVGGWHWCSWVTCLLLSQDLALFLLMEPGRELTMDPGRPTSDFFGSCAYAVFGLRVDKRG